MFVCTNFTCSHRGALQDVQAFRPAGRESRAKAKKRFDDTVQQFQNDAEMEMLNKVRCKVCITCRDKIKASQNDPNTEFGKCRVFYKKMRDEAVCELCSSTENIEFDHIDPSTKKHNLGSYNWWPSHGGVEAMRDEFAKCRPLCRKCHDYVKTTRKRKYEHIEDMPAETRREKQRKRWRRYRDEKAAYVLGLKMNIGACQDCRLPVGPENCHSFHFAHRNAEDKVWNVSELIKNTNCVQTGTRRIDQEVAKCWLLCCDCHKKITLL